MAVFYFLKEEIFIWLLSVLSWTLEVISALLFFFQKSLITFGIFSFPQLFAMVFAMCLFRGIQ